MTDEATWITTTQVTAITGTANLASNNINASGEVTSLSTANTKKYLLGDAVLAGSFSTSVSSLSAQVALYRRDLNIDGSGDAPQPQTASPAYRGQNVGVFPIPPFSAGSIAFVVPIASIALPSGDCEFYIENITNATLLSGYTVKITPKTYMPAA